ALSYLNDKDGIGSGGQNIALVDGNIVLNGLGESFRSGDNLGSNLIPQRLGGPRASLAESFYYTENSRPPWFLRPFENFLTKRAARFNNFNNYSVFEDVSLVDQLRQLQKLRKNVFAGDALENLKSSYLAAYASVDSGFSEKERKNFSKVIGDKFKFIEKRNTYIDKTFGDRLAVLEKEGGEKALETCEMIQGMIFRAKANPNLSSNISVEKTKSYVNVAFSESTGKFEFSLENVSLLPFLDRDRKKKFKELMAKLEDAEGFSRTSSKKFTVAGDGIEKFGKTIGEFFEKHKNNLLESDPLAEKHVKLKELLRQNKSEGLEEQLKHSENIIEQLSEYAKEHDRKMDGLRKNSGREAKAANFKYPRSLSEIEIKKIAESEERRETEKGLKWFERLWVNELRRKRGLEGELSKSKELSEDIEQQVTKPEKPGEEKEEKEGEEKEGEEKEGEEKEEKEEQEEEEEEKSEEEERETTMGLRRVEEIEEKKKRPEEVKRKMEEGEEEPAPKSQEEINESIMAVATLYQQIAENFHSAEASAKHYAATDQIFDLQKKLAESIIAGHGKAKYFGDYSENPQKYAPLFGKENVLTSGGEDVVIDIEQLKKSLTRNEKPDAAVGEEDGGIAPSLQEIIDRLAQVAMAVARRQYNEIHCGGPRGEVAGEEAKAEGSAKDFDTAYFESIEQAEYEVETTLLGRLGEAEEKSDLSGEKTENDPFVKDRSLCDTLCGAEKTRLAAKKRSELAQKRSREVATEGTGERVGEETKSVSVADAGRGVPYREISEAYREAIKKHSNSINFESFGDTRNAIGDSRTLSFKKNDVDFSLKLPEQAANNWDFFKMNRYINKNSGFMVGLLRYVENSPELGIGPSELPDMIETSYGSEDRTLQNDEKMSKLELALVHLGPEDENGKPKVDQLFRNRKCEDLIRKAFAMEDGSKLFSLAKDKARTAKDKFVGISSVRAK
ncbi:MAG: hypothetical protein LBU15_02265, partial [Rickettsiales bacterium]|nr:hypothetical protein [Rickettsiales bacterium]